MSEREIDRFSYMEGYADGFDRGEEAVIHEVDDIVSNDLCGDGEKVKGIIRMIADFWEDWKECES